jgi:hypothetical protein
VVIFGAFVAVLAVLLRRLLDPIYKRAGAEE